MKKIAVLIVNPPVLPLRSGKFNVSVRPRPPLDLAYIQAILKKFTSSQLLDACALMMTPGQTIKYIHKVKPQIVILTSTPLDRWECPYLSIDGVFEILNGLSGPTTILCGSHGTITPDWIFKNAKVDFVVRGEPEIIVKNLVKTLLRGKQAKRIKGLSYQDTKTGKIIHNPDQPLLKNLDRLPFPAYEDLDFRLYSYTSKDIPRPFAIMLTSRGCPFRCIYCFKKMMGLAYRTRQPEKVVAELKLLESRFGIQGVFFQDWEFLVREENVVAICNLIIKNELKIRWGCNGRATDFSIELMTLMKQAGCVRINIGLESGSQKILDSIEKLTTVADNQKAVDVAKAVGISLGTYGLINAPGEDASTLRETAKFLVKNRLAGSFWWSFPIPYFGTKLFEKVRTKVDNWSELAGYAGKTAVIYPPKFSEKLLAAYVWQEKLRQFFHETFLRH